MASIAHRFVRPLCARGFSAKAGMVKPNVAVVGATGAVGKEMLGCIEKRAFPFSELKLFAHPSEAGGIVNFMGKDYTLEALHEGCFNSTDVGLFSSGDDISQEWAPKAAAAGTVVIDNSAAFRMDPNTPLVIPEINADTAKGSNIIANPNCSTILMNVAAAPLWNAVGIDRVVVSTYQAASGAGLLAMQELEQQAKDWVEGKPITQDIFGRQYVWNLFSHNSSIYPDTGYNGEETKMIKETPKIFNDPTFKVAVTCVRVPVLRAHCETINFTLKKPMTEAEVRAAFASAPGIRVVDDRAANKHPEPLDAACQYDVLVGRIRVDQSQPDGYGYEIFCAFDQLLKGAALNAVQIAETLLKK